MWPQLFWLLVSNLILNALAPKPPAPKPASLDDVQAPTAEDGREIPVVFGTCWVTGPNLLWYGDMSAEAIRKCGGKK